MFFWRVLLAHFIPAGWWTTSRKVAACSDKMPSLLKILSRAKYTVQVLERRGEGKVDQ
jgi:hypothetical protein